jgi:hypothetical protein
MAKPERVLRALDHFGSLLSRKKNVVGLGRVPAAGDDPDDWALAVYVSRKEPESALAEEDRVPAELELPDGGTVPVRVIEQGEVGLESPGG